MLLAHSRSSFNSMPTMPLIIIKYHVFVIAASPMLMAYRFFILGVSIADALMALSIFLHFLFAKMRVNRNLLIASFVLLLLFAHILYSGISGEDEVVGYFRIAKLCLLVSFTMISFKAASRELLVRYFKHFIIFSLALLCYQYFVYLIYNKPIVLIIPNIPLVNNDISIDSIERVLVSNFRPAGPFMEPAHLSYYLFFSSLFIANLNDNRNNGLLCVMAVALFSTFSSFGFFGGCVLSMLLVRKISSYFLVIPVFFAVVTYFLYLQNVLSGIPQIARLIDPQSVALTGRLYAGESIVEQLDGYQVYFGSGFGNFHMYGQVNGVNYLILSFGYIGAIFLGAIVWFNILVLRENRLYKIFLFITLFFSSLMLTQMLVVALLPLWGVNESRD